MLNFPSSFLTRMATNHFAMEEVYELELPSGTLYYASKDLTWNGQPYTKLAIERSEIVQHMDIGKADETSIVLDNVGLVLQSKLEGTDEFTYSRVTVRMLMWEDSTRQTLLTDSVVLFRGIMQKPDRITQEKFEIHCIDLINGLNANIPARRMQAQCAAVFANADGSGDCNYSGPETQCNRLYKSAGGCFGRGRQHEFQGFRATDGIQRGLGNRPPASLFFSRLQVIGDIWSFYFGPDYERNVARVVELGQLLQTRIKGDSPFADSSKVIPVVYGYRANQGTVIEVSQGPQPGFTRNENFDVKFYLLSEGECDFGNVTTVDVLTPNRIAWFDGQPFEEFNDEFYTPALRTSFVYWVPGQLGVNSTGPSDYNVSDEPVVLGQERHILSQYADTYSRTAYAIVVSGPLSKEDLTNESAGDPDEGVITRDIATPDFFYFRGIKLTEYSGGVAQPKQWSDNPVWEALDLMLQPRYGLGRYLDESDINLTAAETVAALINDPAPREGGNTTIAYDEVLTLEIGHLNFWILQVENADGFPTGVEIELNSDPAKRFTVFAGINVGGYGGEIWLQENPGAVTIGWTVIKRQNKYSCNIMFDSPLKASAAIGSILDCALAYVSYDENGKLNIRLEENDTSPVAHFRDFGYDGGRGIIKDSFRWEAQPYSDANRFTIKWMNDENATEETVSANDWDSINQKGVIEVRRDFPGVAFRDLAVRLSEVWKNKTRDTGTGGTLEVGPYGLICTPGDIVEITHDVPGWTQEQKRITTIRKFGLGSDKHGLAKITVENFSLGHYSPVVEIEPPPPAVLPSILCVARQYSNDIVRVRFYVVDNGTRHPCHLWTLYRYYSSIGNNRPSAAYRVGSGLSHIRYFEYQIEDADPGNTLYFKVASHVSNGVAFSNEVAIQLVDFNSQSSEMNMAYGGDFQYSLDWSLQAPQETNFTATGYTINSSDDEGLTNASLGIDGDTTTYATGTWGTGNPGYSSGSYYTFGAGNVVGRVRCKNVYTNLLAKATAGASEEGAVRLYYQTTSGEAPVKFAEVTGTTRANYQSEHLGQVNLPDLRVYARVEPLTRALNGSGTGYLGHVEFVQFTGAPWSFVGNNILTLQGTNQTWAEARRAFPGFRSSRVNCTLPANDDLFIRIALKKMSASPVNGTFQVALYEPDTGSYHVMFEINDQFSNTTNSYSHVTNSWVHFGVRWRPQTDICGQNIEVVVRTKSTVPIDVDKLGIFQGPFPRQWKPSAEEQVQGYFGDFQTPAARSFRKEVRPVGEYMRTNTS